MSISLPVGTALPLPIGLIKPRYAILWSDNLAVWSQIYCSVVLVDTNLAVQYCHMYTRMEEIVADL